jgi:hypothetical protein
MWICVVGWNRVDFHPTFTLLAAVLAVPSSAFFELNVHPISTRHARIGDGICHPADQLRVEAGADEVSY